MFTCFYRLPTTYFYLKKLLLPIIVAAATIGDAENSTFVKATTVESGKKYVLVADGKVATGKVNSGTYGYLQVADVTVENDAVSVPADYAFTITAEDEGYTLVNSAGKYFAMKGTYNSFNLFDTPQESYIWTVSVNTAEDIAIITNLDMVKSISYSTQYKNFGAYTELGENIYPTLYILDSQSGITDITADDNAPVEYFNLQGIRVNVDNAAPGLYIRRQGNTVAKILVK